MRSLVLKLGQIGSEVTCILVITSKKVNSMDYGINYITRVGREGDNSRMKYSAPPLKVE